MSQIDQDDSIVWHTDEEGRAPEEVDEGPGLPMALIMLIGAVAFIAMVGTVAGWILFKLGHIAGGW